MRVLHDEMIIPLVFTEELTFEDVPPDTIWITGVTKPILKEMGIEQLDRIQRGYGLFYLVREAELDNYLTITALPKLYWER